METALAAAALVVVVLNIGPLMLGVVWVATMLFEDLVGPREECSYGGTEEVQLLDDETAKGVVCEAILACDPATRDASLFGHVMGTGKEG